MEGCQEITRTEDNIQITEFVHDDVIIAKRTIGKSEIHPSIIAEKWYRGDKLHRYCAPAVIHYKNNQKIHEYWYRDGKSHRDDGPADIWWYRGSRKFHEYWCCNDKIHREGKPAETWYDDNGQARVECWFRDNKLCPIGVLASIVHYDFESTEEYCIGGSMVTNDVDHFRDIAKGDEIHEALRALPIPIRQAIIPHYCYQ